jgi:hypothetical protein
MVHWTSENQTSLVFRSTECVLKSNCQKLRNGSKTGPVLSDFGLEIEVHRAVCSNRTPSCLNHSFSGSRDMAPIRFSDANLSGNLMLPVLGCPVYRSLLYSYDVVHI